MIMPEKTAPLTADEMKKAADVFFPLFEIVSKRMPTKATVEDVLKVMENVAKLAHKHRAEKREEEIKEKFGFNKTKEDEDA